MPPPVYNNFPVLRTTEPEDELFRFSLARFGDMSPFEFSSWPMFIKDLLAEQYSRWCKSRSTPINLHWQRLQWITSAGVFVVGIKILVFGIGIGIWDNEEVRMRETSDLVGEMFLIGFGLSCMI